MAATRDPATTRPASIPPASRRRVHLAHLAQGVALLDPLDDLAVLYRGVVEHADLVGTVRGRDAVEPAGVRPAHGQPRVDLVALGHAVFDARVQVRDAAEHLPQGRDRVRQVHPAGGEPDADLAVPLRVDDLGQSIEILLVQQLDVPTICLLVLLQPRAVLQSIPPWRPRTLPTRVYRPNGRPESPRARRETRYLSPSAWSIFSIAKFVSGTPSRHTVCSRTTRKPCRSKKGRAVMLASVEIRDRFSLRASRSTAS